MIIEILGEEMTFTHVLTHVKCNAVPSYSREGFNETSIMRVFEGELVEDTLMILPHGWADWRKAGEVIKKALNKGWDVTRIYEFMCYLDERNYELSN